MEQNIPCNALKPGYEKYRDEYLAAATRVLDSGWYILGKEVTAFEKEFQSFTGAKHCITLNSGLDALTLAFRAIDLSAGDEVIVPANTYIASVLGITENGGTPIFIEPDEFHNIDVHKIEAAVTSNTKAILVVHLYGQPCQMDKVMEIAHKNNLLIVEDCAQSHGATYAGQMTGTFGAVGCFSFYPTKNLGAFGDGGALITNDDITAEKVRILRNYGSEKKYYNQVQGVNSRLDEIQAAMLRVKLSHIDELTKERITIANHYLNGIKNPLIRLPKINNNSHHVWHQFVINTDFRNALQAYLTEHGIDTLVHYPIPPHLAQAYSSLGYSRGDFPITEQDADTVLSLPMYNGLLESQIEQVISVINGFKG